MDSESRVQALERLAKLRRSGHLTDEEYAEAKASILTPASAANPQLAVASEVDGNFEDSPAPEQHYLDDESSITWLSIATKGSIIAILLLLIAAGYFLLRDGDSKVRYTVTATILNCRAEPSTSARIVGQFSQGATLNVDEERDGWAKVPTEIQECWVSLDFLELEDDTAAASSTSALTPSFSPSNEWIVGKWAVEGADCIDGPWDEFRPDGSYLGYESNGRWQFDDDNLLIAGTMAINTAAVDDDFSASVLVNWEGRDAFEMTSENGEVFRYHRCNAEQEDGPPLPTLHAGSVIKDVTQEINGKCEYWDVSSRIYSGACLSRRGTDAQGRYVAEFSFDGLYFTVVETSRQGRWQSNTINGRPGTRYEIDRETFRYSTEDQSLELGFSRR